MFGHLTHDTTLTGVCTHLVPVAAGSLSRTVFLAGPGIEYRYDIDIATIAGNSQARKQTPTIQPISRTSIIGISPAFPEV